MVDLYWNRVGVGGREQGGEDFFFTLIIFMPPMGKYV